MFLNDVENKAQLLHFARSVRGLMDQDVMPQAAKLCFQDYGRLNEILINTEFLIKELKEKSYLEVYREVQ